MHQPEIVTTIAYGGHWGTDFDLRCSHGAHVSHFEGGAGGYVFNIVLVCNDGVWLDQIGPDDTPFVSQHSEAGFFGIKLRAGSWIDAIAFISADGQESPWYGGEGGGEGYIRCPRGEHHDQHVAIVSTCTYVLITLVLSVICFVTFDSAINVAQHCHQSVRLKIAIEFIMHLCIMQKCSDLNSRHVELRLGFATGIQPQGCPSLHDVLWWPQRIALFCVLLLRFLCELSLSPQWQFIYCTESP